MVAWIRSNLSNRIGVLCDIECAPCKIWVTFSRIILYKRVKLTEPPDAEPHVRWCERSAAKAASYSIKYASKCLNILRIKNTIYRLKWFVE